MEGEAYTLAMWRVKPGQEEAFLRAWQEELGAYFLSLPGVRGGVLLRADPRTPAVIGKLRELCLEATPGVYQRVLTLGTLA